MGKIKVLAGQTMWYGVSSIVARSLFYLLTPYFISKFTYEGYGDFSLVYAAIPFLNVLFTYGIETAFFRFASQRAYKKDTYSTAVISIIFSTAIFTTILILCRNQVAELLRLESHVEFITYAAVIIAFDTLSALPYAKLRLDERPRKYALIRVATVAFQIVLTFFFLSFAPAIAADHPGSFFAAHFNPNYGVGYVIIANMIASVFGWVLLFKVFNDFKWAFNLPLWKTMMIYSMPLIIAGLGGMVNETFDRIMLNWLAPVSSLTEAKTEVAIYSACYKLSILITLFVQAFRMAAEPFFFKQAEGQEPQKIYARVMKFFIITISVMFLFVALYLDLWKYFLSFTDAGKRAVYSTGLKVVPILLFANMFLGIYYNLSIWYKLTNQTMMGAWITIIGAILTLAINYTLIPVYGYMACAWATFICYGSMMVLSYILGQKYYPVPYQWKEGLVYMASAFAIFLIYKAIYGLSDTLFYHLGAASVLTLLFIIIILKIERKEFRSLPIIGKYL